ncbi:MAG: DMT family transporter [Bdellovibrionota bacterium]
MPIAAAFLSSLIYLYITHATLELEKHLGALRIVYYHLVVSLFLFALTLSFTSGPWPNFKAAQFLFFSGIIGFGIAEVLAFKMLSSMGASRFTMVYAFQPAVVSLQSAILIGEKITLGEMTALGLLAICMILLSLERKSASREFKSRPFYLFIALLAVFLDSFGMIYTRKAFLVDPLLTAPMATFVRVVAGLVTLLLAIVVGVLKTPSTSAVDHLKVKQFRTRLIGVSLLSFLSMCLFSYALEHERLTALVAVCALVPVAASIYEHLKEKRNPEGKFHKPV